MHWAAAVYLYKVASEYVIIMKKNIDIQNSLK